MIVAWRIHDARFGGTALPGEGGLHASGRWHHQGRRVVYLSGSLPLAALEVFVHLRRTDSKIPFVVIRVEIPEDVRQQSLGEEDLPVNWRAEPPVSATRELGSAWLDGSSGVLLRVPSVVIPSESNYLLNPVHPDAARVRASPPEPFQFDPRLWKS